MKIKFILYALILLFLGNACRGTQKKNLEEVEKQELARGIRNDSVFEGIYLGMTKEAFADTCRLKHAQGLFDEGGNRSVVYELKNGEMKYNTKVSFYPVFKDNKIVEVPFCFIYRDLELWNKDMRTDKLVLDVKQLMERWYGTGFFLTPLPTGRNAYAQVVGNRRIIIKVEKDDEVMVVVTDLTQKSQ